MTDTPNSNRCEWCGGDRPPSRRGRRFCKDSCRKAASRAAQAGGDGAPGGEDGPVTESVRELVDTLMDGALVTAARAQLALSLARLVDGGSVPAARELRAVLTDMADVEDDDTTAWIAGLQAGVAKGGGRAP